jgi:hypothetical protein
MTKWPEPKRPVQRWPNAHGMFFNVLANLRRQAVREEIAECLGTNGRIRLEQAIDLLETLKREMEEAGHAE